MTQKEKIYWVQISGEVKGFDSESAKNNALYSDWENCSIDAIEGFDIHQPDKVEQSLRKKIEELEKQVKDMTSKLNQIKELTLEIIKNQSTYLHPKVNTFAKNLLKVLEGEK